jgi:hypothetical protein
MPKDFYLFKSICFYQFLFSFPIEYLNSLQISLIKKQSSQD